MTVRELKDRLGFTVCCGGERLEREVTGGYAGDLLSDVIAHSGQGHVWVTIQVHVNIVAVAVLKEHAAILLANGRTPPEETIRKAGEEGVAILASDLPGYALCGKLYEIGVGRVT